METKLTERTISASGYGSVLGVHTDMYFRQRPVQVFNFKQ